MLPLVSIIIPVYNSEKYLEDCLNSVVAQSYKNIEIILIDDGSIDSSGDICDNFALSDKRIKVAHNTNHGVSYSRNMGIDMATGEKCLFVDSDDTVSTEYVSQFISLVCEQDFDLVIGNIKDIYKNSTKDRKLPSKLTGSLRKDFYALFKVPILSGPVCKVYDTTILKENNIRFDETICYSEDLLFNITYLEYVNKYAVVNYATYNYFHRDENSLSKDKSSKNFTGAIKVADECKRFLLRNNVVNSNLIITNIGLNYLRCFSETNDREEFNKRIDVIRNFLNGHYAISFNFKKAIKILLLRANVTWILFLCKKI